jgi:hypothetical protein
MATAAAASTFLSPADAPRDAARARHAGSGGLSAEAARLDDLIAALLRGETPSHIASLGGDAIERLLDRAWFHCVLPLLFEELGRGTSAPPDLVEPLRRESLARGMWELRHQQMLQRLAAELHSQDVRPICFKGTALAYTIYSKPHLRTRCDTDLLVAEADLPACRDTLARLGYRRPAALPGDLVSCEELWVWRGREGGAHAIDLHWRINNARSLAELFSYDDLLKSAEPVHALGGMMAIDRVRGLIVGCIHRGLNKGEVHIAVSGRPQGGERLYWLYDVHLIACGFDAGAWSRVVELSRANGASGIVRETLDLAAHHFHTPVPAAVRDGLRDGVRNQRADRYLRASRFRREISDLLAAGGGLRTLQYLGEVLFPPRDYLIGRFPEARTKWLPWLHLRRWAGGIAKRVALRKAHR